MVQVCPNCDSTDYNYNSQQASKRGGHHTAPTAYTCKSCGHRFEEPRERERKTDAPGLTGLSKQLAEMDPEDL